jgi:uncharacterized protein YodC (DUF2158 family)
MEDERIYFKTGDLVRFKHNLDHQPPKMMVESIDKSTFKEQARLLGITCIWFNVEGNLQRERFNIKDLEIL